MARRPFYVLVPVLCAAGYAWLLCGGLLPCPFHWLTGLPCPGCGAARSLRALLAGDVARAFCVNPVGIVLAVGLAAVPLWLLADGLFRRDTLYRCFLRVEAALHRRLVLVGLFSLIFANWIWNIYKGI